MMEEHPERILRHAVKGMLPVNNLREERMLRLKMYVACMRDATGVCASAHFRSFAGPSHPHAGQVATTPQDMKTRYIKGPTKHPVINAYEKPGLLFELEDLPDEWRLWVTQISDKPEEARKQVAAFLAEQKERRAKLKADLMKSNPEVLLTAEGLPKNWKPAAAAGKPGAKPAAGGKPAPAAAAKPAPAKK